ncbi:helix-turn-helix domain-containing protein [Kitasatospora sp. NPDC088346]|uniref:helix-turn-helix domain-containing protein n=1 Tax=Kitasatospora sp. NPDC088346 TaxID=3364073 RepID=UPI0038029891
MHDLSVRQHAVSLLRNGCRNVEVAERCGVPVGTVARWKHADLSRRHALPGRRPSTCLHCHGDPLDRSAYSYLLGLYLGDGYIVQPRQHRAHSLAITCDDKWPGLMNEVEHTIRLVLPNNTPCRVSRGGCHDVKVYSKHLPCYFPQHGPGKKHERPIVLAPWQQEIVTAHPWRLVRGLIHSDGCRITNWATRTVAGATRRHEYPRYFFTNTSADIVRLFTDTLDAVGVEWKACRRAGGAVNVSVARRASVALLDEHVGAKW